MRPALFYVASFFLLLFVACQKVDIGPTEACTFQVPEGNTEHALHQPVQNLLNEYVRKGLPGMVVMFRDKNGTWVGSAGYADIEKKIPMQPCVVSKVASITKMLVGTLAMKLWEEKKLDLDKKAADYLDKEIVAEVANLKHVTIRQLMNHTSGVPSPTDQSAFYLAVLNNPDKRWKAREIIKYVYDKPEYRCCGQDRASYSDANTLLLSLVLDRILGEHHSIALKREVFDKIGMPNTYYFPHQELPPNTARGYFDLYNNGTIADVTNINTGSGNGYGGTYSTVGDIFHYLETVWRNKQFLSDSARAEMQRFVVEEIGNQHPQDTLYLGQGIMKRFTYLKPGSYGIGHTGRDLGYNATGFYFPKEDVTLMFLVNYGTNGKSSLKPVFMEFQDKLLSLWLHP